MKTLHSALILAGGLSLAATSAHTRGFRPNQVPSTGGLSCSLCHGAQRSIRNVFGMQVEETLMGVRRQAPVNWAAIYNLDADGDGFTNGEELGDPDGVWAPGQQPATPYQSNPADPSSVPAPAPDPDMAVPDPDMDAPDPDMDAPDPDMAIRPDMTVPNPDITVPNPDMTVPNPDMTVPNPDMTALNPDMAIPGPDMESQGDDMGILIDDPLDDDGCTSTGESNTALFSLLLLVGLRRRRQV